MNKSIVHSGITLETTTVACNLCGQEFDERDPLIFFRKLRHENFHKNCKVQKRNTAEGEVVWK